MGNIRDHFENSSKTFDEKNQKSFRDRLEKGMVEDRQDPSLVPQTDRDYEWIAVKNSSTGNVVLIGFDGSGTLKGDIIQAFLSTGLEFDEVEDLGYESIDILQKQYEPVYVMPVGMAAKFRKPQEVVKLIKRKLQSVGGYSNSKEKPLGKRTKDTTVALGTGVIDIYTFLKDQKRFLPDVYQASNSRARGDIQIVIDAMNKAGFPGVPENYFIEYINAGGILTDDEFYNLSKMLGGLVYDTKEKPSGSKVFDSLDYDDVEKMAEDPIAMRELDLYIENEGKLYDKILSMVKNVKRKLKSSKYDPAKAPKLWLYLVQQGAEMYVKEFGSRGDKPSDMFGKNDQKLLAEYYSDYYLEQIKSGEFDFLDNQNFKEMRENSHRVKDTGRYKMRIISSASKRKLENLIFRYQKAGTIEYSNVAHNNAGTLTISLEGNDEDVLREIREKIRALGGMDGFQSNIPKKDT